MMSLEAQIEGLLFFKGEEISLKKLAELLDVSEEAITSALKKLEESYINRGLVLVYHNDTVVLGVSGELSARIEAIRKEELTKELSKAALETLSIILYRNGVTRSEVDYIRGVNSSFIIRNLLVRGLIERGVDSVDSRKVVYRPTVQTLAYMGITSVEQLPGYKEVVQSLSNTEQPTENND
ncbi:MAG: SMC-Scp complex subunit ScpB [Candidatus Pacebacteria bacterium]|jgi:segregation and condensation protein B|nr:SMC-Scp complex subunit ScpB [Candidatus Paceibacterota bacterium]